MPRLLRRALKILAYLAGGLVSLVVLLVAILLIGANTGPGRHLIETETASLTGGSVQLAGITGRFPDHLRLHRIELTDARGAWVTIDDLVLDWHPLALIGKTVRVDRLAAAHVAVPRLAEAAPAKPGPPPKSGGSLNLPLRLEIASLDLPRLDVGAPLAGHDLHIAATGHATIASLAPILAGPTLATLPTTDLRLDITNHAGPGDYAIEGHVTPGRIDLHLTADEPAHGLIATYAGSDQLLPLKLDLTLAGPHDAEALKLALDAGPLTLAAHGVTDLVHNAADLTLDAHAPSMTPAAGVSWSSVALDARVAGPFRTPHATGHLDLEQLAAGGAHIGSIKADLAGDRGRLAINALIASLRIPGPKPDLFVSAPVTLTAEANLADPARPVTFRVTHPLLTLAGHATTAAPIAAHLTLGVPNLAPLAAAAGVALDGHTTLTADITANGANDTATITGPLAITGGVAPAPALIGANGALSLSVAKNGQTITLDHLTIDGAGLHVAASGRTIQPDDQLRFVDAKFRVGLPDLALASPAAKGDLTLTGTATGPTTDLAAAIHAAGNVGARQVPVGPITLDVAATHLPGAPDATIALGGRLDAAPVTLKAHLTRDKAGQTSVQLSALDWKSAHGTADLALAPNAKLPTGRLDIAIRSLADLDRLSGQSLGGAITARLDAAPALARLDVRATGLTAAGSHVARLTLAGTVRDPQARPDLDLALTTTGIEAGGIQANANATARGTLDALALGLKADVPDLKGAPATLATTETLDLPKSEVLLRTLGADWHGEDLRLLAPSRVTWAPAVAVERLRLALADATLSLDGTVSPKLHLTAQLRNVTPSLARPFAPSLNATGTISADANLAGSTANPTGEIRLDAANLHLATGPAASLTPATLALVTRLANGAANLDAHLTAGPKVQLTVAGAVPLKAAGRLAVHASGRIDLAVANPILEQQGRHLTGRLTLDATATGTTAHPELQGGLQLANGDIQDFSQGAHLTAIAADIALAGETVRVERFSAQAGKGTINLNGSVGALAPGLPVDLRLTMNQASPITSDLLSATLDANLTLTGHASGRMNAAGRLTIDRADINIPNGLPPSVATLNVIKPGQKRSAPAGPAAAGPVIGLALAVAAPGEIFVRGHGLDATLGGNLTVAGTATAPVIEGGFQLRRGSFSLAGVNLTFTKGDVGFNGTTNGKLDPTIDFAAQSIVNQYTAELDVTGYASKPKISLHSTPALPQDQVMALLLFGTETSNLSPLQIAQIAAALASLSGADGGFDPLGSVRNTLGLDRLSVGSGTSSTGKTNTGASIEGGKYITKRVYVGARESTAGGGTQALVQIDLTKRLKAFTTVGTGGTVTGATTPENDPGSSVGLKYQFRY
jgi:translocation and assembly module TamB